MKTPAQLKITQAQFDGLKAIAAHLRTDHISHVDTESSVLFGDSLHETITTRLGFNMSAPSALVSPAGRRRYDCGTVACIGGHLSLLLQGVPLTHDPVTLTPEQMGVADKYVVEIEDSGLPIEELFYPHSGVPGPWSSITPLRAAHAIDSFLETGRPDWKTGRPDWKA